MPYIESFASPHPTDVQLVGGKAAGLGRLHQAGFPVPPGFTVTTAAQAEFFAAHGFDDAIAAILAQLDYTDLAALERETAAFRARLLAAPLPAAVATAAASAYSALGTEDYVAVRSSGTAEDLAEASFAGLHDTYLDIRGIDAVLDALKRCWASMWTARATAYRQQRGFAHGSARLAVVVQRMVPAEVAGILFTANPQNARTDEIVINAGWGLGEGIVSGHVTPDEFILAVDTLAIKKRSLGSKEQHVIRRPDTGIGTLLAPVSQSLRDIYCLSDSTVMSLGELGRQVMAHHDGLPQDIEWAYAGGTLYLLQARPVTGVEFTWDEDVDAWHPTAEDENTVWTHTWAEQFLTGGITPLFASLRSRQSYNAWSHFARIYGFEQLHDVHWFKYRRATLMYNCDAERIWQRSMWPPFFWISSAGFGALNLIVNKWYDGDRVGVFQDLITGVPNTLLVHETHELWQLADEIRQSPALTACMSQHQDGAFFAALATFEDGRVFLEHYQAFLRNHGHRGHPDRDLYYARRVEDPALDYRAFQALHAAGTERRPQEIERELLARRQAATEAVVANLSAQPLGGLKAEMFKSVLKYTHLFLKFRDDERHFLDRLTLQKKRTFAEFGRRLRVRGLLQDADDHYFLARHELYDLADGRACLPLCRAKIEARRRVFHRRNARAEQTPPYLQAGARVHLERPAGAPPLADDSLQGMGTSRGQVRGTACVLRGLEDIGRVRKGDILVCNSTDPGWMPVFPLITGLVLETGGMLAHGACLSREYGLPAVQLRNAIALIADGATISVDGDSGEVRLLDEACAA